ncbi:MAG TPA: type IV pilus twitching motility protein PilT [Thermoanaerobaculia bacterium]|jgi:twitching motility protein PilT|nr:type IV pilus twitching motility protein PilT [Thermoanaerobaculia bacterium]
MAPASDDLLFGRIALHYKLVTREQLLEASEFQASRGGQHSLGEILVDKGYLNPRQVAQILSVQREYVAKQQAQAAAAAALEAQAMPALEVQEMPALAQGAAPAIPAAPVTAAPPAPAPRVAVDLDAPCALDRLLERALLAGASDLHIHSGSPLKMRLHGQMSDLDPAPLQARTAERLVHEILTPDQQEALRDRGQVDFAYTLPGKGRFRSNAYRQQRGVDAVFRVIPPQPPTLEGLGLPSALARLANYHQGMVLLTGPAGCGKSSTLAALLNIINEDRHDHIITIEDPIEYIHPSKKCVVNQRQVGPHTGSFARALRGALREDPDIIAIGELRDLETISLALTAAETGHLVLATLHTNNSIRTVNRILGVFPPSQQDQIRTMVSESLRAVVSQRLVMRADGKGRVPALEVLMANKAVGNLIRENKTFQIKSVLQTGASQGMYMLDASLAELLKNKVITREEALRNADDPQRFAGEA